MERKPHTAVHDLQLRDIFHAFEMVRQSETSLKQKIWIQSEELEKEMDEMLEQQKKCLSGFDYNRILLVQQENINSFVPSTTTTLQHATLTKQITSPHAEKLKQDLLQLVREKKPLQPVIPFYHPTSFTTVTTNKSVTLLNEKENKISIKEIEPLEKLLKEPLTNKAKDRYSNIDQV